MKKVTIAASVFSVLLFLFCLVGGLGVWGYLGAKTYFKEHQDSASLQATGAYITSDPQIGHVTMPLAEASITESRHTHTIFTDSIGARVTGKGKESAKGGLVSIGCSWTFGTDVQAEEAFPHLVGLDTKMPSVNLGVPNFSLVQAVLLLEKKIAKIKPKLIIVGFRQGLMTRNYKYNSTHNYLLVRPRFVQSIKNGQVFLAFPRYNPSADTFQTLAQWQLSLRNSKEFNMSYIMAYMGLEISQLFMELRRGDRFQRLQMLLGMQDFTYPDKYPHDIPFRWIATHLKKLADKYGCKVLIYEQFPYPNCFDSHNGQRTFWKWEKCRNMVLRGGSDMSAMIRNEIKKLDPAGKIFLYVDASDNVAAMEKYMAEKGAPQNDYPGLFVAPDQRHPNPAGHRVMADRISHYVKQMMGR